MKDDELTKAIVVLTGQQRELLQALKGQRDKPKDGWDKFAAVSTFFSGVVVAVAGLYFTNSYNRQQAAADHNVKEQQLRLARVEVVHKFLPELNGDEHQKKLALIAISALGDPHLATRLAVLDQSEGGRDALEALAASGDKTERDLAAEALQNYRQYEAQLQTIKPGSSVAEIALQRAISEARAGVWEGSDPRRQQTIKKYLVAAGVPPAEANQNVPWSGAFVSWCFSGARTPPPFTPTPVNNRIRLQLDRNGWLHPVSTHTPRAGDILFLPRRGASNTYHAGIVVETKSGSVTTIEGNLQNMVRITTRNVAPDMLVGRVPD